MSPRVNGAPPAYFLLFCRWTCLLSPVLQVVLFLIGETSLSVPPSRRLVVYRHLQTITHFFCPTTHTLKLTGVVNTKDLCVTRPSWTSLMTVSCTRCLRVVSCNKHARPARAGYLIQLVRYTHVHSIRIARRWRGGPARQSGLV
jgi:hypothetical protein